MTKKEEKILYFKFDEILNSKYSIVECQMIFSRNDSKDFEFVDRRAFSYALARGYYATLLKLKNPSLYKEEFLEYCEVNKPYDYKFIQD